MKPFWIGVLMSVVSSAVLADGCVRTGYYGQERYNGLYLSASEGRWCWYHREEISHGGPALDLVKWRFSPKGGVMLRHDSADEEVTRFGGWFEPVKGGRIELIGAPGRNLRVDVYTPPLKLTDNLSLDGWVLLEQNRKPNLWVGPTVKLEKSTQLWYRQNLRTGGSWAAGFDTTILRW